MELTFYTMKLLMLTKRKLVEVDGRVAVRLWWRYVDSFDLEALDMLLAYNREDVVNLKELKERLL